MFGKKPTRILHPLAHQLYNYHLGVRFDPGAMAEAFQPEFQNPLLLVRGAGRFFSAQFRSMQGPQVWFNPQIGINGLGGLQAGQVILQPLLDPASLEG